MRMKSLGILLVLFQLCALQSRAQLSGTVTVPSATYPTLNDVVTALNTQGVGSSGVTVNVTTGNTQYAPVGGYRLGSTTLNGSLSAASPLVINGNGNTVTSNVGTGAADGIFTIMGADYVTVNALHLIDTNTTSFTTEMEWGYGFVKLNAAAPFDGCQYNVISNCNIQLNRNNAAAMNDAALFGGSKGVMMMNVAMSAPATQLAITATGDANSYNVVKGCDIRNVNVGVYIYGYNAASNYTLYDQNNTVGGNGASDGNTITNYGGKGFESGGIYIFGYANGTYIRGNTINNILNGGVASANVLDGIYHGNAVGGNVVVRKNNIRLTQGAVSSNIQTVYLTCGGTNPNEIDVDSNTLAITHNGTVTNSSTIYGISTTNTINTLNCNANRLSINSGAVGNVWVVTHQGASVGTNPRWTINDNKIDSVRRTAQPLTGNTYGFYQSGTLLPATTFDFRRNRVSNLNVSGYTSNSYGVYGAYLYGGGSPFPVRNYSYDTISNVNSGGAWFYGMSLGNMAPGSVITNNLITNVMDSAATMYGIVVNTGATSGAVCANNTISNLTLNSGSATTIPYAVYGIYLGLFANGSMDVYNNTIYNLQSNLQNSNLNTGVFTCGLYLASAVSVNVYNNFISDLRAPNATGLSPVYGMYLNGGGKFYNVYNNTINIGPGFSPIGSSGTNFGATGIFFPSGIGTPSSDIRNNIVRVNAAASGTGIVSALRGSFGTAGTPTPAGTGLASTSNGNIYWAPADANSYLYCEGSSATTIVNTFSLANDPNFNTACAKYKKFAYPAENSTFTENNLSQVGTTPTYVPTVSSFAKKNSVLTTIPSVTFDYNNIARTIPADAGALQFTGTTAGDFTPPVISYTALIPKTYCLSAPVLNVTIADSSGVNTTTNAPRLYYRKASEADTFGVYPGNNTSSFNGWKYVTGTNMGGINFAFSFDYSKLTSTITGGDSVVYFVAAQDNSTNANVGITTATLANGFCPTSVNLPPAAGPTTTQVSKTAFSIFPQPALPSITPASASVCQGASTRLTAVPTDNPKMATLGTQAAFNNSSAWPSPYASLNGADHEQYLILASELTTQGLTKGNMSSIAFNQYIAYPASDSTLNNYTIQLANTLVNTFPNANFISSGFTTVFSASYRPPATTGWTTINFTTPFYWDGVSNVVVDVSFLNCTTCNQTSTCTTVSGAGNGQVYQTPTSFVSVISTHTNNNCTVPGFVPSGSFASTTTSSRPDMQLMGRQAFNVNWVPTSGLFKDSLMTQPISATDTNSVVFAGPATGSSYAVTNVFNGGCNSIPGTATTVTVNPVPTATTTPANTASFCGGSNILINGSTGSNYTYQWLSGTTPISGATNSSYTASAAGNYTFKATNSSGCSATASVTVSNTTPPPASILANNTTICQGDSAMLIANAGAGYTYQWLQNGTPIAGATNVQYAAKTTGNYTVNVYNASNCFTTSSAKAITVNPLNTTVTASGSLSFCTGSSVILTVPSGSNQTYQWKNGTTVIPGATDTAYTATTTGNYTVTINNSVSGCNGTSATQMVTVGNGPSANITAAGPTSVCAGSTVTLNTTPATGVTYEWRESGTPISGATNASYTASTSGTYTLRVYSSATCFSTSTPIVVAVNPLPNAVTTPAAGAATFCQNGTTILTAATGTNLTYQWSFNGNPINGGTNYNYSAGNAGTYSVAINNTQTGCSATSGNIVLSQVAAPSAPVITGAVTTICAGDSTLLSTTPVAGLTYQWRVGSTAISGATNASVYAKVAGNYTVVATNAAGCTANSNSVTIVVNGLNLTTNPAAGTAMFCQNVARNLSVNPGTSNVTYQWNFNGNPISGATQDHYLASAAGTYVVTVHSNTTGCNVNSGNIVLTAFPQSSVSITGPTDVCAGDTANFVLTSSASNMYQWQNSGVNIPGATNANYQALFSGNIRAYILDVNSCPDTSNVIALNVHTKPSAAVSGPHTICAGDTATLQVASAAGNTYAWKANGNPISGATNATYQTTAAGSYTVNITNAANCKDSSAPYTVAINALPTPAITQNQQTLTVTSSFSTYQWYFNGTAINGANASSYTPTQAGNYYVAVTDVNGCSNKSNTINVTNVGVRNITSNIAIHVYPNPTSNIVNIEAPVKVNVIISDLSGKKLMEEKNATRIDLGDMSAGVYMMTILDSDNHPVSVERIVKSK